MNTLYPDDPRLTSFSHRFISNDFDPTSVRPIVSPSTQTREVSSLPPSGHHMDTQPSQQGFHPHQIQQSTEQFSSPPTQYNLPPLNSPKRPLIVDESDSEPLRPRKLARGESPLKGAAGRRLEKRRLAEQGHQSGGGSGFGSGSHLQYGGYGGGFAPPPGPTPLPRDVAFLLSIIPNAEAYYPTTRFKAEGVMRLLGDADIDGARANQGSGRVVPGGQGGRGGGTPLNVQVERQGGQNQSKLAET
jgi:cleavage stimulation factor subunit 3